MATWIIQAKDIFGALTNGVLPDNATLVKHAKAVARQGQGQWAQNLRRHSLVSNPDGVDMFDIGTTDGFGQYTPDPSKLNSMLAFNIREQVRTFIQGKIVSDRATTGVVEVADAGKTPAQIQEDSRAEAMVEAKTDLGDSDNDPESA